MVHSTRRFVICLSMCHFVLVFFSPFSIAITSLGEERANLSAFHTFVRFVLVWICRFPLPLGVSEGLRFVIVALPGLFSYLFFCNEECALFSLLMYTIITIYGRVKKSVMPLFFFWIIFCLDLELNFIGKLLVFRWELIVLLLLQIFFFFFFFFFFCYERDLMKSLSLENQADIIEAFNSTSRYLDDILNIDNIYFDQMVDRIYPIELQLNRANSSDTEAPF